MGVEDLGHQVSWISGLVEMFLRWVEDTCGVKRQKTWHW